MPQAIKKGVKKNRKFGRSDRKPSQVRYDGEQRAEKNKARRIERNARKSNQAPGGA